MRGLYRIAAKDDCPEDIRVDDDGIEYSIQELIYRARGYEPHTADLPWENDYLTPKKARNSCDGDTSASRARADRERDRQDFGSNFRK